MDDKIKRMKELIPILSEAAKAYYQESREIMSNFEYDRLYDELLKLEQETGTVFAGSPTQKVGYEVLSELPKERHERPMLSLNKTKSVDELREWLGGQTGLLSWKMDGLTVVLTYEDGVLAKAVTRGNGEIGEVITPNARTFINIPTTIPYKGQLILRGEAVISYSDFEKLNDSIADVDAKYKNPRNLCSGSVRQLNSGTIPIEWSTKSICPPSISIEVLNTFDKSSTLVASAGTIWQFSFSAKALTSPIRIAIGVFDNVIVAPSSTARSATFQAID